MNYKKKNFVNAARYVADIKRQEKYKKARKLANEYVLATDKKTISELVTLLRGLIATAGRLSLIPGVDVGKTMQQQLKKLPNLIQYMIEIWGLEEFIRRCEHAIKIDAHRPRNMPILDLVVDPDLFYIGGNFSTFDKNLSKKQIANKTVAQVKEYIYDNITTADSYAKKNRNQRLESIRTKRNPAEKFNI